MHFRSATQDVGHPEHIEDEPLIFKGLNQSSSSLLPNKKEKKKKKKSPSHSYLCSQGTKDENWGTRVLMDITDWQGLFLFLITGKLKRFC